MWKRMLVPVVAIWILCTLGGGAAAQVLNIAIPQDPDSFDPIKTVAAATSEVAFNIYEGLVKATPDGGVEPALASHWTVDEEGTRYTFYLREAFFHDGQQVTVTDVVTSLNRARDPELAVRAGELDMIKEVTGLEDAVQIELFEPNSAFLYLLTEIYASIYPAGAEDLSRKPVGTGPYYLAEWRPNQRIWNCGALNITGPGKFPTSPRLTS